MSRGRRWRRLRRLVLDRDGWRCRKCGRAGRLEVDHARPLFRGGGDELANLQSLCRRCHFAKSAIEAGAHPPDPAWAAAVAELL